MITTILIIGIVAIVVSNYYIQIQKQIKLKRKRRMLNILSDFESSLDKPKIETLFSEGRLIKLLSVIIYPGSKKITREDRRYILNYLEKSDLTVTDIRNNCYKCWLLICKWIHPVDYKKQYPKVYRLYQELHEKPSINFTKSIEKAWKLGKEFEYLEEYISSPVSSRLDILKSLRKYEIRPGISRYKSFFDNDKFKVVTFGRLVPRKEETEIIEMIKYHLKEKFLSDLPSMGSLNYDLELLSSIPATNLIREDSRKYEWNILPEDLKIYAVKYRCRLNTYYSTAYKTGYSNSYFPFLMNDSEYAIVYADLVPDDGARIIIEDQGKELSTIEIKKPGITFIYSKKDNKLVFVGESHKYFYSGPTNLLIRSRKVENTVIDRFYNYHPEKEFSIGDICLRVFGKPDKNKSRISELEVINLIKKLL